MVRFKLFTLLAMAFAVGSTISVHAQLDTTAHQLQTVNVFGKPAEVYAVGSRVSSIDSSYLKTHSAATLGSALQTHTPLYIRQYGVSGISTVTFRGTTAQHTAVLWNGLNIASPSLGQSDFTTLPLSGMGSLAVQHGGAGATYGSGAIGGAVLIGSPVHAQGFNASVQQGVGSYDQYFTKAGASYGNESITVGGSIFWQKAANDFRYLDRSRLGSPKARQEHAAFLQKGFTQDLTWNVTRRAKLYLHSWYTDTDREIQPAMGASHNNANYADLNFRLMAGYDQQNWLGEATFKAAYFSDYLLYTSNSLHSVTDVKTYQAQAEQTYIYGDSWNLKVGANLQHFVAAVEGYGGQVTENRASLFLLTRYDPTSRLSFSLNMRQALAEGYNPPPTPTLGASWQFVQTNNHTLYLKGNVAGSYRLPTLNERFWQPGGNPDLKPEQGFQAEAGMSHVFEQAGFKLETEVTPYNMLINNWVDWRTSGNYTTPVNLQRVRSRGVEFSSQASKTLHNWRITSLLGYTYSASEQVESNEESVVTGNQLAYIPLHKITLNTGINYKAWQFSGHLIYNSQRYTSISNTTALPGFALLDLALGRSMKVGKSILEANLQVNNVTNTVYQTMQNYAMPLRNYTLQISYTFSQPK